MRKIVRWTIGQTNSHAVACLCKSIQLWRKLFDNQFEMVVCYNAAMPVVNCRLVNQNEFKDSLPFSPFTTAWKLYPPRLDIESHEIFIDNDLVLYNKPDCIEEFLRTNSCFITQAWKRSYGKNDSLVPENFTANSGLFGLPPGFDFQKAIIRIGSRWETHFDEQGVVAAIMSKTKANIIPLRDIKVCVPEEEFGLARVGMHFVGLNNGYTAHWEHFIQSILH
jgi:hypothetical protein